MKTCMHCEKPNPEGWFYCKECGQRAAPRLYTVNAVVRESSWAPAIRRDLIDFKHTTIEQSVNAMAKTKADKFHKRSVDGFKKSRASV